MDEAVSQGATVTTGGHRNSDFPNGLFYRPTVSAYNEYVVFFESVRGSQFCLTAQVGVREFRVHDLHLEKPHY